MGALVFNVNATPSQQNDASALSGGNTRSIIPSNASASNGSTAPTMSAAKATSTTGVLIAGYAVKQTASLVTSNIGKVTGNSHLQNQVNIGLKAGATVIGFLKHPVITSFALAADGINYAINTYFTERDDKIRSAQAQAIAGTLRGMKH